MFPGEGEEGFEKETEIAEGEGELGVVFRSGSGQEGGDFMLFTIIS